MTDTTNLRPFDASKCQAGDRVVKPDGTTGSIVAILPDATPLQRVVVLWSTGAVGTYTETGYHPAWDVSQVWLPPIDPPPPRMVPLGPGDIVLGKTVVRIFGRSERIFLVCGVNDNGVFVLGYNTVRDWGMLQNGLDISFDNGATWQRAEKPEGGAK